MMISEDNSRQLESGREKAAQPTRFVEHLALFLSSNFMAADLGSLEGKVHQVLQSLSVSTGSDYIYLLVFNTNGQSPKFQLEWSDEEFYPVDQANSNSIDHRSSWFFNRLRDYHLPENRLTDESQNIDVSSESVWQVTGIKTLLLIPLTAQGRLAGALVLGSCHPRWEYPPDAEFPLRFVGNFLIHEITHMLEADSFRLDAEKYQHAYENIPCGMLILNKDGEIVECNDETASLLGFFNKNDLSGKFFWDFIARSNQNKIKEILANADEPRPIKNFGCSIVKNDGQEFQAELSINLAPISSGIPFQMIAAIHDVSSRQEVHHVLQESEKQLAQQLGELRSHAHDIETLTEMVNMLQICSNQDEAFAVFAKIGRQLFPNLAGSLLILDDAQIRMEVKARWSDPSLKEGPLNRDDCWALRRGRPYLYINTQSGLVCSHVGERLPESYLCTPIIAQGMAIGLMYLESTTDRASLAGSQQKLAAAVAEQIGLALSNLRLRESLREQAIRDPLTGLFNRYYMEESLARELSRARRSNKPIGVIMLDLDHFKELNTRFGHPNVDVMLREFGKLLQTSIRAGDIACRYGGDEFLLILPEASLNTTRDRAVQLGQQVKKLVVRGEDQIYDQMTISVGVACWPQHGQTTSEILHAVDAALLQAKKKHDCVITA